MMRVSETTFIISDDANHAGYNTNRLYRTGRTVVYPYSEHLQKSMSYRTYVHFPGTPYFWRIFEREPSLYEQACNYSETDSTRKKAQMPELPV
jgi:TPR repeat protein